MNALDLQLELGPDAVHARVAGELTIYTAASLREQLLAAWHPPRALTLHLDGVAEIDTAGLQVLLAAKQTGRQHGSEVRLSGHSGCVIDLIERYQLGAWLGDPVVLPHTA